MERGYAEKNQLDWDNLLAGPNTKKIQRRNKRMGFFKGLHDTKY